MFSNFFKQASAINETCLKDLKFTIMEEVANAMNANPNMDVNKINLLIERTANEYIERVEATNIIEYNRIVEAENSP